MFPLAPVKEFHQQHIVINLSLDSMTSYHAVQGCRRRQEKSQKPIKKASLFFTCGMDRLSMSSSSQPHYLGSTKCLLL